MHPLGMYFAITTSDGEREWADDDERALSMARAAAASRVTRDPGRRGGRLTESLRRLLHGTARRFGHLNLVDDRPPAA